MFGQTNNSGTGFGGFGQQNQGTGGGLFGGNTGTTGGAFGGGTQTGFGAANTASPFGAKPTFGNSTTGAGLFGTNTATTQPASGFGAFGNTNTGTTGGFGTTNTTGGGLFGKPAFGGTTTTTGTTGGGLFGTAGTTTGFGTNTGTGGFGAAAANTGPVPSTGTANPPFSAFQEKDPAGSVVNHYQNITFMPQYQKASQEELRVQDYLLNQKFPTDGQNQGGANTGAFGAATNTTGFGTGGFGTNTQNTGTGFGAQNNTTGTGLFGNANTASPFGAAANTNTGGFGAATNTGTTGLFGAKPAGTGLFGGGATTGTNTTGTGLFGAANNNATNTGGAFGGGGAFGTQNTQNNAGGGLFGQNNAAPKPFGTGFGTGTTTGGAFGQTNQATTGFGAAASNTTTGTGTGLFGGNTGTSAFGQNNTGTNTASPFGGGFGQQNQQQQQPQQNATGQTGGLFGGGGFGQNNQAKPPTTGGFGGFGTANNTTQQTNSLFGGAQNQTQTQPAAGGLFGQAKPATGGLFGGGTTGTTTGGGLFGQQPAATNTGGGLFGGAQQNNNNTGGGGLFGAKPATTGTGLFGGVGTANTNAGGGLFGNALGGGNTGGTGLFGGGQQQQQQQQQQGGLFGGSLMGGQQQQQQQNFSTSVNDQGAYGHNPLFSMAGAVPGNTGPLAQPLSGSNQKKKAAMIPLNKIAPKQQTLTPRLGSSFSRSASPFAGSTTGSMPIGSGLGRNFATGSKLHLFDSDDSVLSSGTFTPSSNSRVASLKKLVIDRKIRDQDLFTGGIDLKGATDNGASGRPKNLLKKVVSFDTGVTHIEDEDSSNNLGFLRSSQRRKPIEEDKRPEASPEASSQNALALVKPDEQTENDEGYWMQPSPSKLKSMTPQQLSRVTNFTVGRRGFGQVRFEPAVDLSRINLDEIMGGIVLFDKRVCTVYSDDHRKPEEGVELNVPSVISLEDCYPQHKDTRQKITDPEHPRIAAHLGRLRNIKNTEFMDYNVATGVWIFRVQHFTTYGLDDDDEEEEDYYPQDDTPKATRQQQSLDDTLLSDADADVSAMDVSGLDDTFEFKKLTNSHNSTQRGSYRRELAFPQHNNRLPRNDYVQDDASFLGEGSVGSLEDEIEIDEPTEPVQGDRDVDVMVTGEDDELTETEMDHDYVGGRRLVNLNSFKGIRTTQEMEDDTDPIPKFPKMISWIDQLNSTVVPVKDSKDGILWRHDRLGKKKEARKETPKTYDHMDLMADLYGEGQEGVDFLEFLNTETVVFPKLQPPSTTLESLESAFRNAIRPSWGADGNIYHSKDDVDIALKKWIAYNTKLKQNDLASLYRTTSNANKVTAPLELQYRLTNIVTDDYGLPFLEFDFRGSFSAFAETINWDGQPRSQYEKKVWQLAGILFDPLDLQDVDLDEQDVRLIDTRTRKEKLSLFFQDLVEQDVNRQVNAEREPLRTALAQLTGNRVEQACATLIKGGNLRLATLLSLIGGDDNMRNEIKQQIVAWSENGYLAEIPVEVRAFYELLSGNTCFSKGIREPSDDVAREFYLTEEFKLDWKRAFALKLWYGITQDDNLRVAVLAYQHDMDEYKRHVPKPTPWFVGRSDVPAGVTKKQELDLFWALLKIYTEDTEDSPFPLESVLPFRDFSQQTVDHRLAWQLRTMLARRKYCDFSREGIDDQEPSPARADVLTAEYAQQLEQIGLFEWAAFVLLHLNDGDEREQSVRNLLVRNVDKLTLEPKHTEQVDFLLNLKVPISWIHEAHALEERERGEYVAEAEHLLAAQAFNQAHGTIIRKVGPKAIISGKTKQLRTLLSMFDSLKVLGWATGAGVYQDYLKLVDSLDARLAEHEIRPIAKRLLDALDAVERKTFEQKVAVGEMGKLVSRWILQHGASNEKTKVLKLPLADDQVLRKTLDLSVTHYKAKLAEAC